MLLTASVDGTARLWDGTTGQPANLILRHEGRIAYAEFSPDGQRVVTASDDHTARVWHAGSGRNLGPALRHVAPVSSARFHPAGHRVVTTSEDGLARIWDWRTGRPVGNPLAHKAHVRWAEFSPDGRTVVTASTDGRAGLWDARTGFPRGPMLEHPRTLYFATFSPDGTAIATGCLDRTARVWPILSVSGPAPDWLPDLAEAIAGRRLTQDRTSEVVPVTRYLDLKTRLAQSQGQDPYSNWGRWFVADRSTRATAPDGRRSVREFANDLIAPWDVYYLQRSNRITQALMLDPTNGLAYARYGFALSHLPISPRLDAKLGWLSQQADRWAGQTSDAGLLRARLAQLRGSDEEALALLEAGLASAQDNGLAWIYHAGLLRISGRLEESFASLARAEKVAIQTWPASQRLLRWTRLFNLERHPGFEQEFAAKVVEEWRDRFWRIPPRPPDTPGRCLDLTGFYSISSGHGWNLDRGPPLNLSALPPTWFLLDETPFDVRGVIPLGSRTLAAAGWPWPTEVRGIPVRQTCQRLHFLHATDRTETSGVVVARYRVHFADGQALEIPLRYGHDLGAWLTTPDSEPLPLEPAWRIRGVQRHHQLYHTAWDNPRPTVAIESLDLISTMSDAAPFVLAITMDPFPASVDPPDRSTTIPPP
jgi:tetratricopeptide (TPR) repeat protein